MTHFVIPTRQTRPQPVVVLTDDQAKRRLSRAQIILKDGPADVMGRVIGWKRAKIGVLAAVVLNEVTGARFLVGVNMTNDRHDHRSWRILERLA